eukprot:TRINITY_DN6077_c0_g1_i1.p1 TRINITY_DN6077_c0_g1~~TRINITY_DN6077_c0_g1_i1.p1  ORF type:complete len:285 (+),score=69.05 TRINITY_DN6077_c0_g1_i1:303-1157(+)
MRRNGFNVDNLALQLKSLHVSPSLTSECNQELYIEEPVTIPLSAIVNPKTSSAGNFCHFFGASPPTFSPKYNDANDWLFLGSVDTAMNRDFCMKKKISHVLIVARELYPFYPGDFKYKKIPIDDDEEEPLIVYLEDCFAFIDKVRTEGGRVLVHCRGGVSRSASVILAYLMMTNRWTFKQAENYLRTIHTSICPNEGFISQLHLFEKMGWSTRGKTGHHRKYRDVHLTKAKILNHKRKLEEEKKEMQEENKSRRLEIGSAKEEYGYYLRAIEDQLTMTKELVED